MKKKIKKEREKWNRKGVEYGKKEEKKKKKKKR